MGIGAVADRDASTRSVARTIALEAVLQRDAGITAALLGWVLVGVGLLLSAAAAGVLLEGGPQVQLLALEGLSFGVAVAGLGTAKTGIAFILWGILRRIWSRIASAKAALPDLVISVESHDTVRYGVVGTRWGRATVTREAPRPLFIHRMARTLWAPMLLMGAMALYAGLVLAVLQFQHTAANPDLAGSLKAWVQGVQFLGEGLLLSAISLFLGSILGAIRSGGGDVQQSLDVPVKTLQMPLTAKLFVGLMMGGLMIEIVQFVLYARLASMTDAGTILVWSSWLGPFREFGLGVLLSGIVLALATIANALDFQFARIRELIETGR